MVNMDGHSIERKEVILLEGKGHCEHGEFNIREGCQQCIAARKAEAEVNSPENIAKRVAEVQPKLSIVKVRYYSITSGEVSPREYIYYSEDHLTVGDIVTIPVRDTTTKAEVSAIDVPEEEIAAFKDKVKTIPAGSKIVTLGDPSEEGVKAEEITEDARVAAEVVEEQVTEIITGDGQTAIVKIAPDQDEAVVALLNEVAKILEYAKGREVTNAEQAKLAASDLGSMKTLKDTIEGKRKEYVTPLNEYVDKVNGFFKLLLGPLKEAYDTTGSLVTSYKVELKRKENEAIKLNEEAAALARKQAEFSGTGEITVNTKPVPIPAAPKLTRSETGSVGLVDNWKYEIVDMDQVPREYMVVDDAQLKSIAKAHHDKKPVAGIKFYNEPGFRTYK